MLELETRKTPLIALWPTTHSHTHEPPKLVPEQGTAAPKKLRAAWFDSELLEQLFRVRVWTATTVLTPELPVESSTVAREIPRSLKSRLAQLMARARDEEFEDGVLGHFGKELIRLTETFGVDVLQELTRLILSQQINVAVAAEALRWVGHMDHPPTHQARLSLLERSLQARALRIRDGAVLGLSFMGDRSSVLHLRRALERESVPALREDMQQVLSELEQVR